ncbi:putative F-box protein At1g19160 [Solanum dulcamara]|uniref:putative F-box protein At1g19160 n=1 Tax=Solanum dulcamara TaxID=45834 RepID=UPI0024858720|nr:putative F-box protein At1g19160 [Solanum dulcamara]
MEPAIVKSSIPQDIIFNIFSTLSVKSLMRFKSVSKFCNSLISESVFVDIHQYRTSKIKFIVRQRAKLYTIEAMEEQEVSPLHIDNFCGKLFYNHIMCVNNLLCCSMHHVERVAICNPSTKVVRTLPCLKEFSKIDYPEYFCSMGFDPEEKTYKVLMTINGYEKHTNPTRNWVFTLAADESWREIKGITDFAVITKNVVCVGGVIYMLSYSKHDILVIAFDVRSENFRIVTLWNSLNQHIDGNYYNIIKVNGKLAILNKKNLYLQENMDLWIFGKEEWEKHIIQIPQQWTSPEFERPTFCSTCDGEILFTNRFESRQFICFRYNVTEKRWRNFEIQGLLEKSSINDIYSYDESLFPVERICNSD